MHSKCVGLREVEAFTLLWVIQCSYENDYDDKANEEFFYQSWITALSLTLSHTIPSLHSAASFTEASQISPGHSMRAQLLQDMLQGRGINHSPEQELWQA